MKRSVISKTVIVVSDNDVDAEPLTDDKIEVLDCMGHTTVFAGRVKKSDVAAAVRYEHQLITTRLVSKLEMMGVEQDVINSILNTVETAKKEAFNSIVDGDRSE